MAVARKLLGLFLVISGFFILTLFAFVGVEHAAADTWIKVMIAVGRVLQGLIPFAIGARLLGNSPIRTQQNKPSDNTVGATVIDNTKGAQNA